jgi:hypothetical protein
MGTAGKQETKTFYFTNKELLELKDPDIEKRLNTLLGTTWETAKRFFNDNGGFQMENILNNKKQTIGFTVYTIDDPYASFPGVPDDVVKLLNNPPPIENFEEFLKTERKFIREMYRRIVQKPYD